MKIKYDVKIVAILTLYFCFIGCEKFIDIDLPNSGIVDEVVFQNDATAVSAVKGMYHTLYHYTNFASGSPNSVTACTGLYSDELDSHMATSTIDLEFYQNEITVNNSGNNYIWSSAYNIIYMANAILDGLATSKGVTRDVKRQLEGEARFVRAFTLFTLVNLYGDVPLVLGLDYQKNALLPRNPKTEVYSQIVMDLKDAQALLAAEYPGLDRTRPNQYAATALLARVYLYLEEWEKAEIMASEVIGATNTYALLQDLDNVFLINSKEAIWQIMPEIGGNTREGNLFILETAPPRVALSEQLIDAFELGDQRQSDWVGYFEDGNGISYPFPYKYKIKRSSDAPTEYSIVMRYAEQFLIRAEARVQQNKLLGAREDLDKIRSRGKLPLIKDTWPEIDQDALFDAIQRERRIEFFTEWGHRWFDLKRTYRADIVLGAKKTTWQTTDALFPIPETEMTKNPNLTQNEGY